MAHRSRFKVPIGALAAALLAGCGGTRPHEPATHDLAPVPVLAMPDAAPCDAPDLAAAADLAAPADLATRPDLAPRPPLVLVEVGDSITEGKATGGGYRCLLRDRLAADGIVVVTDGTQLDPVCGNHDGASGARILGGAPNSILVMMQGRPPLPGSVVLLLAGTNDTLYLSGAEDPTIVPTALNDLRVLLSYLLAVDGVRVILATIPPNGVPQEISQRRVVAFNAGLANVAKSWGPRITLVDVYAVLSWPSDFDGSSPHPNAGGYLRIAAVFANGLHQLGVTP